jgi:hypothetical protein
MSSNFANASTNTMSTFTPVAPSQELLDSLSSLWEEQQALEWEQEEEILLDEIRYHEYARQEEKKNEDLLSIGHPPVLRRERPEDYIIEIPPLVRQDTVVLPPPVLRRERPEDYLFVTPDRIHNIQMPRTPVANRTSERDLSQIRPRRLFK